MAQVFTMNVTGFTELEGALRQLPEAVAKGRLLRALKKAAQPVADELGLRAPRSPFAPHIAENMVVATKRVENYQATVAVGPKRAFFYGTFPEWGTSKMPARPWMRPAWDSKRLSLPGELGRHLWDELAAAARRLARSSS